MTTTELSEDIVFIKPTTFRVKWFSTEKADRGWKEEFFVSEAAALKRYIELSTGGIVNSHQVLLYKTRGWTEVLPG